MYKIVSVIMLRNVDFISLAKSINTIIFFCKKKYENLMEYMFLKVQFKLRFNKTISQKFNFIFICSSGVCDEHEYRLTRHLLDGYDAGVRPAKNSSKPLVVVFGLSLHHIIDVVSIRV